MERRSDFVIATQIRNRSTRLPGKMLRPFFQEMTIPELIVGELLRHFPADRIVIATSRDPGDDGIMELAERWHVRCSRGSEQDVLHRMVEAVRDDAVDFVVRVCGDNPFLRAAYIIDLIELIQHRPCDYASFALPDGTPTILSHLGLFAEVVRKATLEKIERIAQSPRHREHITSHILDHLSEYECRFLDIPAPLRGVANLRLTVDTKTDFEVGRELYEAVVHNHGRDFSVAELVHIVRSHPELQAKMAREIATNEKR